MENIEEKAKKLIKGAMKQPLAQPNDPSSAVEVTLLCPTCFETRKEKVDFLSTSMELVERIKTQGQAIMHQCPKCRQIGKDIDLDILRQVLEGNRIPLPDIDENFTLSDLVTFLLKKEPKDKEE